MDQFSPVKSSVLWTLANGLTAVLWRRDRHRYLRMRYEDLMAAPRSSMQEVARFAGIDPDQLPFVDDDQVQLGDGHVLAGNPNRRNTGPVRFRLDQRWETGLPRKHRLVVTAITSPVRRWMGYRWSTP